MDETFSIDCLSCLLLVFEVTHEGVSTSQTDLPVSLGVGIADTEL
jgi:hypothetical protein